MITRRSLLLDDLASVDKYRDIKENITKLLGEFVHVKEGKKYILTSKYDFYNHLVYAQIDKSVTISYDFKSDLEEICNVFLNNEEIINEIVKYITIDILNLGKVNDIVSTHVTSIRLN